MTDGQYFTYGTFGGLMILWGAVALYARGIAKYRARKGSYLDALERMWKR